MSLARLFWLVFTILLVIVGIALAGNLINAAANVVASVPIFVAGLLAFGIYTLST